MAGYNLHLKDKNSINPTPINLIIRYENITVKYSTGEKILPTDWLSDAQKKREIRGTGFVQFNIRLTNIKRDADEVFKAYQNANNQLPTPTELKELLDIKFNRVVKVLDRPKVLDLFGFIEDFITESKYRKNKRNMPIVPRTIQQYQIAFDKLKAYKVTKKLKELNFDSITPDFYKSFEKFLIEKYKHSPNTIANNFKMLKVFFNDAHDKGYLPNFISKKLEVKRVETFSIFLTEAEIESIYNLDLSHDKKLERVKDLFVVGCWTALRFSDLSKLDSSHIIGDRIKIKTQKTGTNVSIPIHPFVLEIIKKYKGTLPKAPSNDKMNVLIKQVGEMAGITQIINYEHTKALIKISVKKEKYELITTHTARRSFSSNMYLMGFGVQTIMAITGHKTVQSFMAYIKLEKDDHSNTIAKVWEQKGIFKQA
jgi:integrase